MSPHGVLEVIRAVLVIAGLPRLFASRRGEPMSTRAGRPAAAPDSSNLATGAGARSLPVPAAPTPGVLAVGHRSGRLGPGLGSKFVQPAGLPHLTASDDSNRLPGPGAR